jgi:DNA polymerase I-like protein with 3'-5' exonuclease and polymerase domains
LSSFIRYKPTIAELRRDALLAPIPTCKTFLYERKLGKRIRALFTPDYGHIAWEKDDASQIEYRELAHYAVDDGDGSADKLREAYNLDPKTNYHHRTRANVKELTGMDIEHRPIKNMNFGLVYGMSEKKLIRQNGFNPEQGSKVFKAYHRETHTFGQR